MNWSKLQEIVEDRRAWMLQSMGLQRSGNDLVTEEHLRKLFGILLHVRFVSSPSFINFFCHLFILVWSCGYLFYTLGYNPILLYFVAQIVPFLVIGSSFSWFLWNFEIPPSICICVCVLSTSLLSATVRCSRYMLYISSPALESPMTPRSPEFSYWRMAVETKILVLGVLIATGLLFLLGPLS